MKRTLTVLLMLMLITSLSAQRRSTSRARKTPEPVLPQMTVDEAMASYDFESAEILLNHEIEIRKKRKESTLEQEEQLSWMHKAQMKLNGTSIDKEQLNVQVKELVDLSYCSMLDDTNTIKRLEAVKSLLIPSK